MPKPQDVLKQPTTAFLNTVPPIFEQSVSGRQGVALPPLNSDGGALNDWLPAELHRADLPRLPEVSQLEVMRHFVKLSQLNMSIDSNFYPLGSCTMKYNPKICDWVGQQPGFNDIHPEAPTALCQGTLAAMHRFQTYFQDLTGFSASTIQPAAGAQGELAGMMMIKAYHQHRGDAQRTEVLVPDSAHGTNPASAVMCGFKVIELKSGPDGLVDVAVLKAALSERTAAIMLTNPNTVGLFEKDILTITTLVHEAGGLCYYDGANLNAVMGRAKMAHMGFDVMHMNTHKTFATPHGGGGPGSGPVGVNEKLEPFLPTPVIATRQVQGQTVYELDYDRPLSIGQLKLFYGNAEVILRALAYMESYGAQGLKAVSDGAVLNANYLKASLKDNYHVPFEPHCMHEFILTSRKQKEQNKDLNTMVLAKRLMDYGFHPPTVYFPLIIPEIMMIEPTETEAKQTLDTFITAMKSIAQEAIDTPEVVLEAPHTTPVKRVDEVRAAKQLDLNYFTD